MDDIRATLRKYIERVRKDCEVYKERDKYPEFIGGGLSVVEDIENILNKTEQE